MSNSTQQAESNEARVKQRRRRVVASLLIPLIAALAALAATRMSLGGKLVTKGESPFVPLVHVDPTYAMILSAILTVTIVVTAIWNHRVIDEQDERAGLWSGIVAFYVICVAAMTADLVTAAGLIPQISHTTVVVIGIAPAIPVYLWLRFR